MGYLKEFFKRLFCEHKWAIHDQEGTRTVLKCDKCRKLEIRELSDFY